MVSEISRKGKKHACLTAQCACSLIMKLSWGCISFWGFTAFLDNSLHKAMTKAFNRSRAVYADFAKRIILSYLKGKNVAVWLLGGWAARIRFLSKSVMHVMSQPRTSNKAFMIYTLW